MSNAFFCSADLEIYRIYAIIPVWETREPGRLTLCFGGATLQTKERGDANVCYISGSDPDWNIHLRPCRSDLSDLQGKKIAATTADAKKARQISDDSPEKLIGYFPMKNINDKLSVKKYIDLMQTAADFRFNVFDMVSALVYARLVHPCSKSKTYDEVIPKLFDSYDFSLNQLYDGLGFSFMPTGYLSA